VKLRQVGCEMWSEFNWLKIGSNSRTFASTEMNLRVPYKERID